MWYEGENYHLFALRGQLLAMGWARQAGVDLLADPRLAARLEGALRAPALTALPDFTFPARKDSRFGVSLAQPMYLELWEVGLARLGDTSADLWDWLRGALRGHRRRRPSASIPTCTRPAPMRRRPARPGRTCPGGRCWRWRRRCRGGPGAWRPGNTLLEGQGLAILRDGNRYASLECGAYGGGHGHPDRLHLTLHADGNHWLADPGTGSYVARDLFWYRSTLAHNAPRLDGLSQPPGDADAPPSVNRAIGPGPAAVTSEFTRTVVAGSAYLLDVVELSPTEEHLLELPWHPAGESRWYRRALGRPRAGDEFVSGGALHSGRRRRPVLLAPAVRRASQASRLHLDRAASCCGPSGPGTAGLDGAGRDSSAAGARVRSAPGVRARVRRRARPGAFVAGRRRRHRGGDGGGRRPPRAARARAGK